MPLHVLTLPFVVPQVDVVEFEEMKASQKSDLKELKAELKRELKEELKTLETSFDGKVKKLSKKIDDFVTLRAKRSLQLVDDDDEVEVAVEPIVKKEKPEAKAEQSAPPEAPATVAGARSRRPPEKVRS